MKVDAYKRTVDAAVKKGRDEIKTVRDVIRQQRIAGVAAAPACARHPVLEDGILCNATASEASLACDEALAELIANDGLKSQIRDAIREVGITAPVLPAGPALAVQTAQPNLLRRPLRRIRWGAWSMENYTVIDILLVLLAAGMVVQIAAKAFGPSTEALIQKALQRAMDSELTSAVHGDLANGRHR